MLEKWRRGGWPVARVGGNLGSSSLLHVHNAAAGAFGSFHLRSGRLLAQDASCISLARDLQATESQVQLARPWATGADATVLLGHSAQLAPNAVLGLW